MADTKFKVGDLVQLKSGGAIMVVQYTKWQREDVKITCIWHDKNHRHNEYTYPQTLLKLVQKA